MCLAAGSSCPEAYFDNAANSPLASDVVCQPCTSECLSCTGPLNTDCQSCRQFFASATVSGLLTACVSSCAVASNPATSCGACHSQCVGCSGPSNQQCVACRSSSILLDGTTPTCVPQCDSEDLYLARPSLSDTEHECRPCHAQCRGCTGPGNTDCIQCRRGSNSVGGVTTCLATCPADTYEDSRENCAPCHGECAACTGPTNQQCVACRNSAILVGGVRTCVPTCGNNEYLALDAYECRPCHAECLNCTGATNQDCIACRNDIIALEEGGAQTCVPTCSNSEYLLRSSDGSQHECRACHARCFNCTGPGNADCLQCREFFTTTSDGSVGTCVETCPALTYEVGGSCRACNAQCSGGCRGSTNRDCSSCLESSVQLTPGVTECLQSCPAGMIYNADGNCELTL